MTDIKAGKIIGQLSFKSDINDKVEEFIWVPMLELQVREAEKKLEMNNHLDNCPCDECAGGCDGLNPTCGDCFLCEAKALKVAGR